MDYKTGALLACTPEGTLSTQPPFLPGDQVDEHRSWADFSEWLLISKFPSVSCIFGYKLLLLPNPGSCAHPVSPRQKVQQSDQVTTCHHSLENKLGSNKILLILRKMVPCDQSREECNVTTSQYHGGACISFFPSKYFPPQIYSSLSSLSVCNVPVHFVAIYTCARCVANNAEGKDLLVQEVTLPI